MAKNLKLTLSKKQKLLFNDIISPNIPEIYVEGSVQSGKTFDICLATIQYAQALYKYDSNEIYYGAIIGWTINSLSGNIINVLEQDLNKLGLINRAKNRGHGDFSLNNDYFEIYNLRIYFFGFNNVLSFNNILGRPLIFIWCDESARIYSQNTLRKSFDELAGRQASFLIHPYVKMIHSFNVEGNENHPYKKKYIDGKPKAKHYTFFPYDNPKLNTEEAMIRVREMYPEGSALQEQKIFNKWVVAEGKVFPKLNVIHNLDDYILREIGLGDDYGSVNPTTFVPIALAFNTKIKKWCLVRLPVYYHDPSVNGDTPTTEFYSNQLRIFMLYVKEHYQNVPLTTNVIDSEAAHFKNRLEVDNVPFSESDKSDGVSEGVEHLQSLIDKEYFYILEGKSISQFREDGTPEFSGKDESLIEFESYQYDTTKSINTGQNCYKKELDHSIDACLTGDTLITTLNGKIKIKNLVNTNGYALSYDIKNKKFIFKKYSNVRKTQKNVDIYKLTLSNGKTIKGTYNHPVLTTRGYIKLGELKSTDEVICHCEIINPLKIEKVGKDDVYNMEVEDTHNYVANEIVVHNCRYLIKEWVNTGRCPQV